MKILLNLSILFFLIVSAFLPELSFSQPIRSRLVLPRLTINGVVLLNASGNYPGMMRLSTVGSFVNAPWINTVANGGTGNHNHVYHHLYNTLWNDVTDAWERIEANEHAIRIGYESRFTTGDPATTRGSFEYNVDIARNLTGVPAFDRRALFLSYGMDVPERTAFAVGDAADLSSALLSMGFSESASFIMRGRSDRYGIVYGTGNDPGDATQTNRIIISNTVGFTVANRAAWVRTDGGQGESLVFEAGRTNTDVEGAIYFGLNRTPAKVVTMSDFGIGTINPLTRAHIFQSTADSEIMRLETTDAVTNPVERTFQAAVQTTDATVTTLQTISTVSDNTYTVFASVSGGQSGGANNSAGYVQIGTFENAGGTLVQVGTTTLTHTAEDVAAWDVTMSVSGTNILVRVTGVAAITIDWTCTARVQQSRAAGI